MFYLFTVVSRPWF